MSPTRRPGRRRCHRFGPGVFSDLPVVRGQGVVGAGVADVQGDPGQYHEEHCADPGPQRKPGRPPDAEPDHDREDSSRCHGEQERHDSGSRRAAARDGVDELQADPAQRREDHHPHEDKHGDQPDDAGDDDRGTEGP